MTRPDIEAIRARANAATPGPWLWWGNMESRNVRLLTAYPRAGPWGWTVMDFVRWGTQDAAPRFSDGGLMYRIDEPGKAIFRVCPDCTDPNDERIYRRDIEGIRHPDAQFIADARQDVDDLLAYIAELEAQTC